MRPEAIEDSKIKHNNVLCLSCSNAYEATKDSITSLWEIRLMMADQLQGTLLMV